MRVLWRGRFSEVDDFYFGEVDGRVTVREASVGGRGRGGGGFGRDGERERRGGG